jgi:hypothetical protein
MSRMNMLSSAPSTPAVHSHSSLFLLPYAMCAISNVFNTTIHRNLNQVNPTIALSHLLKDTTTASSTIFISTHFLQVKPGDKVLDLWHSTSTMAAKSIVLAQAMWLAAPPADHGIDDPTLGILYSNDSTFGRHLLHIPSSLGCALAGTLGEYVPAEATETGHLQRIQVVPVPTDGHLDFAKRFPLCPGSYDRVILDVDTVGEQIFPAERDSDQSQAPGPQETIPEMTVRYRAAYVQLLLTALDTVQEGGGVLYCAPSIAHDEHDRIVYRATQHTKLMAVPWYANLEVLPTTIMRQLGEDWALQTRQGWLVRPNHRAGTQFGPFYFAVILKHPSNGAQRWRWKPQDEWERKEQEEVKRSLRPVPK